MEQEQLENSQINNKAIALLAKLKTNHHNLRAILKEGDVFDSLNYEEGIIDSLIELLAR